MKASHRIGASRQQLAVAVLVTFAAVVLSFAAFDDITTDTATTFTFEWAGLAVCGAVLFGVCWWLVRREQWWLAGISAVALVAAAGAGSAMRPGIDPFQIEYLATSAALLWFLGLAGILARQAAGLART